MTETIISTVVGAIIGGGFSLLGVFLTIRHQENKTKGIKQEKLFDERPKLEIVDLVEYEDNKPSEDDLNGALIETLAAFVKEDLKYSDNNQGHRFIYPDIKRKNFESYKYTLRNYGKTNIYRITLTANVFPNISVVDAKHDMFDYYVTNGFINLFINGLKQIKVDEQFSIIIHYPNKSSVIGSNFGAYYGNPHIRLVIEDENHRCWTQLLHVPINHISTSDYMDMKLYGEILRGDVVFGEWK
jgi:hypothetical protein